MAEPGTRNHDYRKTTRFYLADPLPWQASTRDRVNSSEQ